MSYSIFTLGASQITVSNGGSLSGGNQGDASHLAGQTITLNSSAWQEVFIDDDDANFADNDSNQTLDGAQVYDGSPTPFADGTRVEAEYTITVTDGSQTYTLIGFNINEPGAPNPFGTIEGLAFIGGVQGFPPIGVPLSVVTTGEGPGASTTPATTYATPCFTPGTRIDTPRGPVQVQDLAVGDLVMTLDDGPQPILWMGSVRLSAADLLARPRLAPVTLRAGALGPGSPAHDLTVSPQHRILIEGAQAELLFGQDAVLVPALSLVNGDTIRQRVPVEGVTYIHMLFQTHQILWSNGLPSESYLPGPMTLPELAPDARAEVLELFPALAADLTAYGPPARPVMSAGLSRALGSGP